MAEDTSYFPKSPQIPAFANTVITSCFPVSCVRFRAWLLARGLCCPMQSSSLLSHLSHKTNPAEAARILSYTRYSLVHSEFSVFYGFVRYQDLLESFSGLKITFFKSIHDYCESGKSFWAGTQRNHSGFHSGLMASNHIRVTHSSGKLWFLSAQEQHRVGCRFKSGGSQVPSVRCVCGSGAMAVTPSRL